MKLKDILDKTTTFLRDKKIESPRLEAELLLAHGLKLQRIELYLKFDQPLKEDELVILRDLVRRRAQGEPVAYIMGYRDFYKYRFIVNSAVLIPRPETEHIVEDVLNWSQSKKGTLGIIDLGAGSGCLGLTLLKELPEARLVLVDISEEALKVSQENAKALDVSERVRFVCADASDGDVILSAYKEVTGKEKIDILVSNPPYIATHDENVEPGVKKFEPSLALYAEDEGLALLKSWSQLYSGHLQQPGLMLMEMGRTQGQAMWDFYSDLKVFDDVRVLKDLSGHDRIIRGEKKWIKW